MVQAGPHLNSFSLKLVEVVCVCVYTYIVILCVLYVSVLPCHMKSKTARTEIRINKPRKQSPIDNPTASPTAINNEL